MTADETTPLKNDHHSQPSDFQSLLDSDAGTNGNGNGNLNGHGNLSEEDEGGGGGLLRRKTSRSREGHHRRDSSLMEVALESIHDMTEVFVERLEEVQHIVVEGIEEVQHQVEVVQHELVEVMEEPVAVPVKPREEGDHNQKLSAIAVAVLVFYKVSGGPFGCEPSVKAAGPFYALLGFTLFPILWCIPEALITAELGSAFPEPSGCKC